MSSVVPAKRLEYIEEMFQDQLEFKISAILSFIRASRKNKREIESFIDQLKEITDENIRILQYLQNTKGNMFEKL